MPIVPGNEPPRKGSSGFGLGWLLPLLIFGPTLYRFVRGVVADRVSDEQFLIVAGGLAALVVMAVVVQRVNRFRDAGGPGVPPSFQQSVADRSTMPAGTFVPRSPQYEPIITRNVVLAGIVLAVLLGGAGFLLLGIE